MQTRTCEETRGEHIQIIEIVSKLGLPKSLETMNLMKSKILHLVALRRYLFCILFCSARNPSFVKLKVGYFEALDLDHPFSIFLMVFEERIDDDQPPIEQNFG